MKIGIIGAGKVGTTLGKYLMECSVTVTGYYSRTYKSAQEAADFTKTKAYNDLKALIEASDTLFITTPDGEIGNTWDCIVQCELEDKTICHFSGSLSSHVFSGIEATGAKGCSIHPMYAFSDKFTSYQQFHTAFLTMEGEDSAVAVMQRFFETLGHKVLNVLAKDKMKYHAAAALASNYMIGLFQASLDLLSECGFDEKDSQALLTPLIENNVRAMLDRGTVDALTGPIERNDLETIKKHLESLGGTDIEMIYRSIGKELVTIAQKRNPKRDYTALEKLL